jgi:L-asparaginase II
MIPKHVPLVVTTRGGFAECVHLGSIAVVDRDGRLIAGVGDPQALNFTRSALKPLQALGFVQDDGLRRFGFNSHELALMCASHSGEPVHVDIAAGMLRKIDAGERDLGCGCHVPYFFTTLGVPPPSKRWSTLHNNCSGKHSGFLAFCRLHGEPLTGYLDPDSRVQQRVRQNVQAFAPGADLKLGIDGCSAPNFAMPLARLAQTYGRIALAETPELAAIRYAMTHHPDLVSGTLRTDLALMQTGAGDWVTKMGADGVQAIGVASRGIGIAVRIADGSPRAVHAATVEVLLQLGLLDSAEGTLLARDHRPPIRNARGIEVGRIEPQFSLPRLH